MYLFDITNPKRDGALENDIPIHEYQHGITNRLTGGSSNAECLEADISAGLDEGFSDSVAVFINRRKNHTRHDPVLMGEYVGDGKGIRTRPYSTDMNVNNLTCKCILPHL
jgi:extracellular elastinolytic metalloproteinase